MNRRYVNQLANGESVDELYLVADKQLRANRQGNLYLHLELRDKTGAVGARLWNASEELARTFEPGDYLRVRGKVQVFQGALQMILSHMEVIAGRRPQMQPGRSHPARVVALGITCGQTRSIAARYVPIRIWPWITRVAQRMALRRSG